MPRRTASHVSWTTSSATAAVRPEESTSGFVWVLNAGDSTITRFDPKTYEAGAVGKALRVGRRPSGIAAGEGAVWVANEGDNTVTRINPLSNAISTIRVGGGAAAVAVGGGLVWVANGSAGTVSRIDRVSNEVMGTVKVGNAPSGIVFGGGLRVGHRSGAIGFTRPTVLTRLLSLLFVFGIVGGTATAAANLLTGTYKVTITGKPAPLNGTWQLAFLPRGALRTIRNGKTVVIGRATWLAGNRLRVSDRSGSYACSAAEGDGVYTYKVLGRRLTFTAVKDKCVGRKLILTTKPFLK